MQRYFLELSYKGTNYHGWQIQPRSASIQGEIESELSKVLRNRTPVVGCGRTDTGVHASQYFAHFETEQAVDPGKLVHKLNRMLPADIAIKRCFPVPSDLHARFSAISRSYRYDLHFEKDPFKKETSWLFPFAEKCDWVKAEQAADLILKFDEFFPFCKSKSDTDHYKVDLTQAAWEIRSDSASFHITGNRFLRGMVRLIVGACLNAGLGKLSLDTLQDALDHQVLLPKSWSAPAEGLFLVKVAYPDF